MNEKKAKVIHVKIYRSRSQDREDTSMEGEYKEYEIPYEERMTLFTVFDYIYESYDRSFAFYKSCRIGRCSGCFVEVDGKNKLACGTLVEDGMKIGPAKGFKLIRDLAVDLRR